MIERSETITAFAKAFAKARSAMDGPRKAANNPHFKTRYADLEAVIDACEPSLTANGIVVIQSPTESGEHMETVLLHESGEWVCGRVPLIVNKRDMQGLGSAITYARRYGLLAMCGLAPEDDDGNAAAAAPPRHQARREEQPQQQAEKPRDTPVQWMARVRQSFSGASSAQALDEWWDAKEPALAELATKHPNEFAEFKKAWQDARDAKAKAPADDPFQTERAA